MKIRKNTELEGALKLLTGTVCLHIFHCCVKYNSSKLLYVLFRKKLMTLSPRYVTQKRL